MQTWIDRIFRAAFILAFIGIAFVGGVILAYYDHALVAPLKESIQAGEAWAEKQEGTGEYYDKKHTVEKAVADTRAKWNEKEAWNGYTLITIAYISKAFLLDMQGNIVYKWDLPFAKVWPDHPHVRKPVPPSRIYFEKAHAYPNGDLLAIYMGFGDTPYGYGLVKMDKDSRVIWKYTANTHHDFHVAANGNIITLTHEWLREPPPGLRPLAYPTLADFIAVLSPEGKELQKISVLDAFANSSFKEILFHQPFNDFKWDSTHANSVDILEPEDAKSFPLFRPGQFLLSLRNINTLAVIDAEKPSVVWASNGLWEGQHSARFLPNGHFLLFDNHGFYTKKKRFSRILEFNPATLQTGWTYSHTRKPYFYSYNRGRVQRLPNGNTLITETLSRRAFEVTPEGKIVWDYRLPVIYKKIVPWLPPYKKLPDYQKDNPLFYELSRTERNVATIILNATRYAPQDVPFVQ